MAKKISHVGRVLAPALLMAAAACNLPPDDAAKNAWEHEGCNGRLERPCPESYCTCWDRTDVCRCPPTCPCARRHAR